MDVDPAEAAEGELWNFFKKSAKCSFASGGANGCGCCSSGSAAKEQAEARPVSAECRH